MLRVLLCCAVVLGVLAASGSAEPGPPDWVKDELLVAVRPDVAIEKATRAYQAAGGRLIETIDALNIHRIQVPAPALENVQTSLAQRSEFEFVAKNELHAPAEYLPDDPDLALQWHLPAIDAPSAWDHSWGEGTVIAILDTGVNSSHADLAANMLPGWDAYAGGSDTSDVHGHGTLVAGSAASVGDNALGIASPAWNAQILPVRVTSSTGYATTTAIVNGITYATDQGADAINVSFASVAGNPSILAAAEYAFDRGSLVVAGSGNCGCREDVPDSLYILSVGATDAADILASFSSRGPYVDVTAPGVSIRSTTRSGGYAAVKGTSHSGPVAAGVAALLHSVNPALTAGQVSEILQTTSVDLGSEGYDESYGEGRVDAAAAVQAALTALPPAPDSDPPQITDIEPVAGEITAGMVLLGATVTDDRGVDVVEFVIDGARLASDQFEPYEITWDSLTASDGVHSLVVIATDDAGNSATSKPVEFLVDNSSPDFTPPTSEITSPADGSSFDALVKVDAYATDDRRVARVDLLVNGTPVASKSCDAAVCAVRLSWNGRKQLDGSYTLAAVAWDAAGNSTTSASITLQKGPAAGGDEPDDTGDTSTGRGNKGRGRPPR